MRENPLEIWRKAVLTFDSTLQQAILNLNETGLQISLVVSNDDILLGTVTDGDIRRGLLRGLDMHGPIESIIHKEPLVVPPQLDRDTVLQLMQANKIHQLPVVDDDRRIVGLHLWDNLMVPSQRSNIMIIMAGGQGTRLRPHTENCPKPLLPVGGKPMLEHIIERARSEGFQHFVLAVHYLGEMIEEYFGDGSRWQVKIEYLREEEPLGTAGAIGLLEGKPDTPFLVTNGDVLTDIRYGELLDFHSRHNASATMAVRLHEWQHPFGVVRTKGLDIIGFEEILQSKFKLSENTIKGALSKYYDLPSKNFKIEYDSFNSLKRFNIFSFFVIYSTLDLSFSDSIFMSSLNKSFC